MIKGCLVALSLVGSVLLMGCSESGSGLGHTNAPVYQQHTSYGAMPMRSEAQSNTKHVAGFPEGHPLNSGTQADESTHMDGLNDRDNTHY
ncbi:MAG: hypothetical protein COB66_03615 [Coxiella sp. (in: Bacteria)]|nr:MAG: hypothetical protein COB66_03615 [Coxiella sp. (in: g-proteobacteria)]